MFKFEHHTNKRIGVAVSGGLDSTIVLHHLVESGNDVVAYTMRWGNDEQESIIASRISGYYGAEHRIVDFNKERYWKTLDICMSFFDKPRYMVWPHMILEDAKHDGCDIFYNGEGCDEIYGYQDRSYIQGWIDLLEYHLPCWIQSASHLVIELITPFRNMEQSKIGLPNTMHLYCGTKKERLWEYYKDKIPEVIYPKIVSIPTYYSILGKTKRDLIVEATKRWLSMQ